jgi:hypothetical protein
VANDRAKVFYSVSAPTSGMKTNDLWVNGSDIYRYSGAAWVKASRYDVTETVINGGLITTGAITFGQGGQQGGMAGSGDIRIWSGGSVSNPTFSVDSAGNVDSKGSITAKNDILLLDSTAGLSGCGPAEPWIPPRSGC